MSTRKVMIDCRSYPLSCGNTSDYSFEENAGEITLTGVRQDGNDRFTLELGQCRQPGSDCHCRTTRDPRENAFFAGQPPGEFNRLVVTDQFNAVNQIKVQDLGNKPGTNALNLVRARLQHLPSQLLADHRGYLLAPLRPK